MLLVFSVPIYVIVVVIQDLKDRLVHKDKDWFYSHFYSLAQTEYSVSGQWKK